LAHIFHPSLAFYPVESLGSIKMAETAQNAILSPSALMAARRKAKVQPAPATREVFEEKKFDPVAESVEEIPENESVGTDVEQSLTEEEEIKMLERQLAGLKREKEMARLEAELMQLRADHVLETKGARSTFLGDTGSITSAQNDAQKLMDETLTQDATQDQPAETSFADYLMSALVGTEQKEGEETETPQDGETAPETAEGEIKDAASVDVQDAGYWCLAGTPDEKKEGEDIVEPTEEDKEGEETAEAKESYEPMAEDEVKESTEGEGGLDAEAQTKSYWCYPDTTVDGVEQAEDEVKEVEEGAENEAVTEMTPEDKEGDEVPDSPAVEEGAKEEVDGTEETPETDDTKEAAETPEGEEGAETPEAKEGEEVEEAVDAEIQTQSYWCYAGTPEEVKEEGEVAEPVEGEVAEPVDGKVEKEEGVTEEAKEVNEEEITASIDAEIQSKSYWCYAGTPEETPEAEVKEEVKEATEAVEGEVAETLQPVNEEAATDDKEAEQGADKEPELKEGEQAAEEEAGKDVEAAEIPASVSTEAQSKSYWCYAGPTDEENKEATDVVELEETAELKEEATEEGPAETMQAPMPELYVPPPEPSPEAVFLGAIVKDVGTMVMGEDLQRTPQTSEEVAVLSPELQFLASIQKEVDAFIVKKVEEQAQPSYEKGPLDQVEDSVSAAFSPETSYLSEIGDEVRRHFLKEMGPEVGYIAYQIMGSPSEEERLERLRHMDIQQYRQAQAAHRATNPSPVPETPETETPDDVEVEKPAKPETVEEASPKEQAEPAQEEPVQPTVEKDVGAEVTTESTTVHEQPIPAVIEESMQPTEEEEKKEVLPPIDSVLSTDTTDTDAARDLMFEKALLSKATEEETPIEEEDVDAILRAVSSVKSEVTDETAKSDEDDAIMMEEPKA